MSEASGERQEGSAVLERVRRASEQLEREIDQVAITTPAVGYVYNYLNYARAPFELYLERYLPRHAPIEALFMGMNPGPWGTAQTGVPFGSVDIVRRDLGIKAPVGKPKRESPKRPIEGFELKRSEVSGERLWGWIKARWGGPQGFAREHFLWSHCPLMFIDQKGSKNITPPRLLAADREALYEPCDRMFMALIEALRPKQVIGIGRYAYDRALGALRAAGRDDVSVHRILHPSPASPAANRGWRAQIERELAEAGFAFRHARRPSGEEG